MEKRTVQTAEFAMDYVSFGSGERAFVIIPGVSVQSVLLSADAVAAAYKAFGERYTVYLFDRRQDMPSGYTVSDMADDTAKVMQELGISDADCFGTSQGGMILQILAAKYPHLIHKAVFASTACRIHAESAQMLTEWNRLSEGSDIAALNHAVFEKVYSPAYRQKYQKAFAFLEPQGTQADMQRFARMISACDGFDCRNLLPRISCPVFVIGAWEDAVLTAEASIEISRILKCPLYLYAGFGHAVYDEAEDYKERLLRFFAADEQAE